MGWRDSPVLDSWRSAPAVERSRGLRRKAEVPVEQAQPEVTPPPQPDPTVFAPPAQQQQSMMTFGVEHRNPDAGEDAYFRSHPEVAGMAGDDDRIVLNPYSRNRPDQQQAVARNEAIRIWIDRNKPELKFSVTEQQKKAFQGTEYGKPENEHLLKSTLVARILTGDQSAGAVTDEQRAAASRIWEQLNQPAAKAQQQSLPKPNRVKFQGTIYNFPPDWNTKAIENWFDTAQDSPLNLKPTEQPATPASPAPMQQPVAPTVRPQDLTGPNAMVAAEGSEWLRGQGPVGRESLTANAPEAGLTFGERVPRDIPVTAAKAAVGLPQAVTGVLDWAATAANPLASVARLGKQIKHAVKGEEDTGFQGWLGWIQQKAGIKYDEAQQILETAYSPEQQKANQSVANAKGLLPKIGAALQNPSVVANTVIESIPQMLAGGAIGKAVGAVPQIGKYGYAIGEGAIAAGSGMEQARAQSPTGRLTDQQVALLESSGVLTGAIGALGGKVASRLGIEDIDKLVAGNVSETAKRNVMVKALAGALVEGGVEEAPQSVQEKIIGNLASGKPWHEGWDEALVMGALTGAAMGAGAQLKLQSRAAQQQAITDFLQPQNVAAWVQNHPDAAQQVASQTSDTRFSRQFKSPDWEVKNGVPERTFQWQRKAFADMVRGVLANAGGVQPTEAVGGVPGEAGVPVQPGEQGAVAVEPEVTPTPTPVAQDQTAVPPSTEEQAASEQAGSEGGDVDAAEEQRYLDQVKQQISQSQQRFQQDFAERKEGELWSDPTTASRWAKNDPEAAKTLAKKPTYLPQDFEEADLPAIPDPKIRKQWKGWVREYLSLPDEIKTALEQEPSTKLTSQWSRVPDGIEPPASDRVEVVRTPFGSLIKLRPGPSGPGGGTNASAVREAEGEVRQVEGSQDLRGAGEVEVPAQPAGEVAAAQAEEEKVRVAQAAELLNADPANIIPVYRGTGERGATGLKATEGGAMGSGVYFYTARQPAESHVTAGKGKLIVGYIDKTDPAVNIGPEHENVIGPGLTVPAGYRTVVVSDATRVYVPEGQFSVPESAQATTPPVGTAGQPPAPTQPVVKLSSKKTKAILKKAGISIKRTATGWSVSGISKEIGDGLAQDYAGRRRKNGGYVFSKNPTPGLIDAAGQIAKEAELDAAEAAAGRVKTSIGYMEPESAEAFEQERQERLKIAREQIEESGAAVSELLSNFVNKADRGKFKLELIRISNKGDADPDSIKRFDEMLDYSSQHPELGLPQDEQGLLSVLVRNIDTRSDEDLLAEIDEELAAEFDKMEEDTSFDFGANVEQPEDENAPGAARQAAIAGMEDQVASLEESEKRKQANAEIESLSGTQQNLFGKKGLPGQQNLFADKGVPEDMVQRPSKPAEPSAPTVEPESSAQQGDLSPEDFADIFANPEPSPAPQPPTKSKGEPRAKSPRKPTEPSKGTKKSIKEGVAEGLAEAKAGANLILKGLKDLGVTGMAGPPINADIARGMGMVANGLIKAGKYKFQEFIEEAVKLIGKPAVKYLGKHLEAGWTKKAESDSRLDKAGSVEELLAEPKEQPPRQPKPAEPETDVDKALRQAGLNVEKLPDGTWQITGNTYEHSKEIGDVKREQPDLGGWWRPDIKAWTFRRDPRSAIADRIASAGPTAESEDAARRSEQMAREEARRREDERPDVRRTGGDYAASVDRTTKDLIARGLKHSITQDVVDSQIEDIGMVVDAAENNRPMFVIGSAPGTGKTFVLGGVIRELRSRGFKKFVYVTQNQNLISQVKDNLADYGLEGVEFTTYTKARETPPNTSGAVLLLDEAHSAKNTDRETGKSVSRMVSNAQFTVYSTATPFENVTEAEYLGYSGIFDDFHVEFDRPSKRRDGKPFHNTLDGFNAWAWTFGANVAFKKQTDRRGNEYIVPIIWWDKHQTAEEDQFAANEWLKKRGVYVQHPMTLPPGTRNSEMRAIEADKSWADISNEVVQIYADAEAEAESDNEKGKINAHKVNVLKRLLEAAKVDAAIARAKELIGEGKKDDPQVIIFVNTKQDLNLGSFTLSKPYRDHHEVKGAEAKRRYKPAEMDQMMQQWYEAREAAEMMGDGRASVGPPPFAIFIHKIAMAMDRAGLLKKFPSVIDKIMDSFPGQAVEFSGRMTDAQNEANLAKWKSNEAKLIVATMDKGGTGLSFHDTTGTMPSRYQVNMNLPWSGTKVEQVGGRLARYGTAKPVTLEWIFANNIPFDRELSKTVGSRMRSMSAAVQGRKSGEAKQIREFDFEAEAPTEEITREQRVKEIQDTFNVTREQAEVADLLHDMTDVARERIQVSKPGELPPADSLQQISQASARMAEAGKKYATEEEFFAEWDKALRAVKGKRLGLASTKRAVDEAVEDIASWLEANPQFQDYYAKDNIAERAAISQLYPELQNDAEWAFYKVVGAIASNSTQLSENVTEQIDAWGNFRENQKFDVETGRGIRNLPTLKRTAFPIHGGSIAVKAQQYLMLNQIVEEQGGVENAVQWLMGTVPASQIRDLPTKLGTGQLNGKQVRQIKDTVKAATGSDQQIPRIFAFGPKLGAYAMNHLGRSEYTTVDVWESRFWRSFFREANVGTGLEADTDTRAAFKRAGNAFAEKLGLSPSAAQAVRWYYMIQKVNEAGYTKARSNETISAYTQRQVAKRIGEAGARTSTQGQAAKQQAGRRSSALRRLLGETIFGEEGVKTLAQQQRGLDDSIKGWTHFVDAAKAIIGGTDKADISTFIHEFAHPMRRFLFDRSIPADQRGGITDEDIGAIEAFCVVQDGAWDRKAEERFATAWEQYWLEGKSPNAELEGIFQKIARWMAEVYGKLKEIAKLTPEVRAVFDKVVQRGKIPPGLAPKAATRARTGGLTKAQENSIDRILDARDRLATGKIDKKVFEREMESIRTHALKLGIEVESVGTYFYADKYRQVADDVAMRVAQRWGGHPTAKRQAARDSALGSTSASKQQSAPVEPAFGAEDVVAPSKADIDAILDEDADIEPETLFQEEGEPTEGAEGKAHGFGFGVDDLPDPSTVSRAEWLKAYIPRMQMGLPVKLEAGDFASLASAFGGKNPFAADSPLMKTMQKFAVDADLQTTNWSDGIGSLAEDPAGMELLRSTARELDLEQQDDVDDIREYLSDPPFDEYRRIAGVLAPKLEALRTDAWGVDSLRETAKALTDPLEYAIQTWERAQGAPKTLFQEEVESPEKARTRKAVKIIKAAVGEGNTTFDAFVEYAIDRIGPEQTLRGAPFFESVWEALRQRPGFTNLGPTGKVADLISAEEPEAMPRGSRVTGVRKPPSKIPPKETPSAGLKDYELTGMAKAVMNDLRELANLPELLGTSVETIEQWAQDAEATVASDPGAPARLLNEIISNPTRALDHHDVMLLAFRYRELANQVDPAFQELVAATESKDSARIARARTEFIRARQPMTEFEELTLAAKSTWGRTGVALQVLLRKDNSLAGLLRRAREANHGEELSDKQKQEMADLAAKFADLQKKLDAETERADKAEAEVKSLQHLRDVVKGPSTRKKPSTEQKSALDKAWGKIAQIENVSLLFQDTSNPYIEAVKLYRDLGVTTFAELRRHIAARAGKEQVAKLEEQFKQAWEATKPDTEIDVKVDTSDLAGLTREARKIERDIVEGMLLDHSADAVVEKRDQIIDQVHEEMQAIVDGEFTRRQTMDALSAYGQFSRPSQETNEKVIRDLNAEVLKLSQIDQLEKAIKRAEELRAEGKTDEEIGDILLDEELLVAPTGPQRDKPTDRLRRMTAEYNELKKSIPASTEGRSGLLQTAVAAIERALGNRIRDLDYAIRHGEPINRGRKPSPTTPKIEDMKSERDRLLKIYREMFPQEKKKLTPEQRLANAIKAADRSIAVLEKQLETRDFDKVQAEPLPESADLAERRARLEQLRAQREAAKALELSAWEGEGGAAAPDPKEAAYRKAYISSLRKRIADLQQFLAEGDFAPKEKKLPRQLSRTELDLKREYAALNEKKLKKMAAYHLAHLHGIPWTADKVAELLHLARAIETSFDFSALLRQGGLVALGHPDLARRALMETVASIAVTFDKDKASALKGGVSFEFMQALAKGDWKEFKKLRGLENVATFLKTIDSRKAEIDFMHRLTNGEWGEFRTLAGLDLPSSDQAITKQEEVFQGRWGKLVPGVAVSSRLYTMILNKMRADLFDLMVDNLGRDRKVTLAEAKLIADFVNVVTGRSSAIKWRGRDVTAALNLAFFAPRYVASRFQYLAMPFYLPFKGGLKANWQVKRRILKEYGRTAVGAATVLSAVAIAAQLFWDDDDEDKPTIGLDPTESDFLKVKIGETRRDFLAGLQQIFVLGGRMMPQALGGGRIGDTKFGEGGLSAQNRGTILGRFARQKLAPGPGYFFTAINDWTDVVGNKADNIFGWKVHPAIGTTAQLFQPLALRDVSNVAQNESVPLAVTDSMLSIFGVGVSTYGPQTTYRNASKEERTKMVQEAFDLVRGKGMPDPEADAKTPYPERLAEWRDKQARAAAFLKSIGK